MIFAVAMEDSILQESRPIAVGLVSQKMSRTKRKAAFHSSPRRAVVNGSGEVMLKPNNVLQSTETVVTFGMDDRKEVLIQQNASAASLPTSNIINSEIKDEGPLLADVPKSGDVDEVNTHKSKDIETTSSSHHLREINCVVEACDSSERNNNDNDLRSV